MCHLCGPETIYHIYGQRPVDREHCCGVESKSFDRYLADVYIYPSPLGGGTLFAPMLIAAGLGVSA